MINHTGVAQCGSTLYASAARVLALHDAPRLIPTSLAQAAFRIHLGIHNARRVRTAKRSRPSRRARVGLMSDVVASRCSTALRLHAPRLLIHPRLHHGEDPTQGEVRVLCALVAVREVQGVRVVVRKVNGASSSPSRL